MGRAQGPNCGWLPGLRLPDWFQTLGRGAWLLVGIAVLLAIAFFLLGLTSDLVIPLVQATAGLEEAGSLPGMAELDTDQAVKTLGNWSRPWCRGCCPDLARSPCSSSG